MKNTLHIKISFNIYKNYKLINILIVKLQYSFFNLQFDEKKLSNLYKITFANSVYLYIFTNLIKSCNAKKLLKNHFV